MNSRDVAKPASESIRFVLSLMLLLGITLTTSTEIRAQEQSEETSVAMTEGTTLTADRARDSLQPLRDHLDGTDQPDFPAPPLPPDSTDQTEPQKLQPFGNGTVKVTAQPNYDRGGLHRLFYGSLWRDLWGTEIEVPVLDLERTAGGLTPIKLGGGRQTTSLRFLGADNREYKFRSIDKDLSEILPGALQETFVDNVLQDMISAQHPVGGLVAAPLLDAVDVLHATSYLYVMPDDPRLGEYREQFAGMLGTIEENPEEGPDDTPGFMGYTKISGYENFYEDLQEENKNSVDGIDFLKLRLVDMVIGDWGRHRDQFRFARAKVDGENVWRAIPRDRDMAFARYNGLIPSWAELAIPEIEGFEEDIPDVENFTWTGKVLDRRFLVPVSKAEWDSTTRFVIARLSDKVISDGVHRMPPEYFALEGEKMIADMRSRRDQLTEASDELFELVHDQADLWGSDEDEYVDVERVDDEKVTVSFYRRDTNSGEKKGEPYFQHTFTTEETEEIRIVTLGGDDKIVVRGTVNSSITVKVDGGKGKDEYVDDSKVKGFFFFTPIPDAETSTYFFDGGDKSTFTLGDGTRLDRHDHDAWQEDTVAYVPFFRDYGNDWMWAPWLGYSSVDGIYVGLRTKIVGYGFRMEPYAWEQSLGVAYAFGSQGFIAEYNGDFRTFIPNARVLINATASELELANFYGFGNVTPVNTELETQGYYDVGQRHFQLTTDVQVPEISDFRMYVGGQISHTATQLDQSPILDATRPYGVDPTTLVAMRTGLVVDTRDYTRAPTKGVFFTAEGEFFPTVLDNREPFAKGRIDARTYLSTTLLLPVTLALRGLGQKVVGGEIPYFELVYLGGGRMLRGYERERFSGTMALSGNAELRLTLFKYKLIARSSFGLIGFADVGRVFLDSESSDDWHHSFGGGVAIGIAGPNNVITVTMARAEEGTRSLNVRFGYSF